MHDKSEGYMNVGQDFIVAVKRSTILEFVPDIKQRKLYCMAGKKLCI